MSPMVLSVNSDAVLHPQGLRALKRAYLLGRGHASVNRRTSGVECLATPRKASAVGVEIPAANLGVVHQVARERWPPGSAALPTTDADWLDAISPAFDASAFARALEKGDVRLATKQVGQLVAALQRYEQQHESPKPELQLLSTNARQSGAPALSAAGRERFAAALGGHQRRYFRLCLKRRRLESALDVARNLPASAPLFTGLLKECLAYGDLYAINRAIKVRKEVGLPDDGFCYSVLLRAAARENQPAKIEALLEKAWDGGVQNPAHFNVLIGHHNLQRDPKAAFAMYFRMLALGVEPDVVTMNLLIEAAGQEGRLDLAMELYDQMQTVGPAPASRTFVHLFSAAHASQHKDPEWIMKVFADMLASGIQPITQHWVTFLVACGEAPLSGAQIQGTVSAALAFCRAAGGDCAVCAALLKFCTLQGIPEQAADIWKAIRKAKHKLDSWVFTALFTACAANSCPELKVVVTQAASELDLNWLQARDAAKAVRSARFERGWTMSYNALLNAFAKMGTMTAARDVFCTMQRQGPSPDIISYNTLLAGYAQAEDTGNAFKVFYELCETSSAPHPAAFKLRPNARTFGALLHACARQGNADSAKKVVELMKRAGVAPTAVTYTSLMHACVKHGSAENVEYAFQIFKEMKAAGCVPTAVTYGCMMNACELAGRLDQAFTLYQEACDRSVLPTDECHNILIGIFARSSRLEEALAVIERLAQQKGVRFQAGALNSLVRALAPQHTSRSLRLLSFVRELGLRVHRETLTVLISACSKASLIDTAHTLYWELRSIGVGATREAGSHLIMALCQAGRTQLALQVYEDMVLAVQGSTTETAEPRLLAKGEAAESPAESIESVSALPGGAGSVDQDVGAPEVHAAASSVAERLSAADLLGIRRKLKHDGGSKKSLDADAIILKRRSSRHKRAVFPHARAMAALVQTFALERDLDTAFQLYRQLQRDSVGAAAVTLSDRCMWQALIEVACRKQELPLALEVFDDWKAYCATQAAMHRFDEDPSRFVPNLSTVTLAFLEACCRTSPEFEWRVYDVCAAMRQQQEREKQAALPRPRKQSHHFAETEDGSAAAAED